MCEECDAHAPMLCRQVQKPEEAKAARDKRRATRAVGASK